MKCGRRVDLSRLMYEMAKLSVTPYPEMIDALRCLRAEGIKTALLTNNFNLPNGRYIPLDTSLFDIVSCLNMALYIFTSAVQLIAVAPLR